MVEISVSRQGVRFGGNANNGNCSPRIVYGNNYVANTNRNYACLAEYERENNNSIKAAGRGQESRIITRQARRFSRSPMPRRRGVKTRRKHFAQSAAMAPLRYGDRTIRSN